MLAAERYDGDEPVNLGAGREITIRDLTETIGRLVGFQGTVRWDATQPDGQPRRMLDTSRARELFGFEAQTSFEDGLKETIDVVWHNASGSRSALQSVTATDATVDESPRAACVLS